MTERTVERMVTAAKPRQLDETLGFPMGTGLGVMMGGRRFAVVFFDPHEHWRADDGPGHGALVPDAAAAGDVGSED